MAAAPVSPSSLEQVTASLLVGAILSHQFARLTTIAKLLSASAIQDLVGVLPLDDASESRLVVLPTTTADLA